MRDFDGDGWMDLYVTRVNLPNLLFRNKGDGTFEEVGAAAGVDLHSTSAGCIWADIDNDGDQDLYVLTFETRNYLYINDGTGHFQEQAKARQVDLERTLAEHVSTSAAFGDVDNDGDLDLLTTAWQTGPGKGNDTQTRLFINDGQGHFSDNTANAGLTAPTSGFTPAFVDVDLDGWQDILIAGDFGSSLYYHNQGNGVFIDQTEAAGVGTVENGMGASVLDIDNDGDPDWFVSAIFDLDECENTAGCAWGFTGNRLYLNDGQGHFQAIDKLAIRHTSKFTMAVDFSDIDRDGDLDFLLIDMLAQDHQRRMQQMGTDSQQIPAVIGKFDDRPQIKRNTLFLNRGDNTYAEIGQFSGVHATEWTWSTLFLDVDLDGYEDILLTNGQLHDFEDADTNNRVQSLALFGHDYRKLTSLYPNYLTANIAFRNKGDLTFENVSEQWGFTVPDVSWGMALADFDNDGDLDIAINRLDKPAGIYRNESNAPRVAVRLKGLPVNSQGVGAKIRVLGGPVPQSKEVICGGTYLSGSDHRQQSTQPPFHLPILKM